MMIDYNDLLMRVQEGSSLAIETLINIIENSQSDKMKIDASKVLINKILPDLHFNFNKNDTGNKREVIRAKLIEAVNELKLKAPVAEIAGEPSADNK